MNTFSILMLTNTAKYLHLTLLNRVISFLIRSLDTPLLMAFGGGPFEEAIIMILQTKFHGEVVDYVQIHLPWLVGAFASPVTPTNPLHSLKKQIN